MVHQRAEHVVEHAEVAGVVGVLALDVGEVAGEVVEPRRQRSGDLEQHVRVVRVRYAAPSSAQSAVASRSARIVAVAGRASTVDMSPRTAPGVSIEAERHAVPFDRRPLHRRAPRSHRMRALLDEDIAGGRVPKRKIGASFDESCHGVILASRTTGESPIGQARNLAFMCGRFVSTAGPDRDRGVLRLRAARPKPSPTRSVRTTTSPHAGHPGRRGERRRHRTSRCVPLGLDPELGEGPQDRLEDDQRPSRDPRREVVVQRALQRRSVASSRWTASTSGSPVPTEARSTPRASR